ncbi:hypothetical protein SprV_0200729200 [Sparganum proliferum]
MRQLQLRWSGLLVHKDNGYLDYFSEMSPRVPADKEAKSVATWTLKTSRKRLQINPANWKDLARDLPTRSRTVKAGTPKPNARLSKANCALLATPTLNQPRPSHSASGRSGR